MANTRPRSIVLNSRNHERIYHTYKDWLAEQSLDERTPEQRGIGVGSLVMWRYLNNDVIVTDRATVMEIDGDTLTLRVKDVSERMASANVREIVSNAEDRLALSLHEMNRRSYLSSQPNVVPTQEIVS